MKLVRLRRERFDRSPWYGFAVLESEQLLVVHAVSDRYDLDGYHAFRRLDITSLDDTFERRDLIERALRLKQLRPERPPTPSAIDMRTLLEAVQAEYGLVTIYREAIHPDECEIGRIRISSDETYVLHWLDTEARWSVDDRPFRFRDVTRVDFGGEYERTLLAVARDREGAG